MIEEAISTRSDGKWYRMIAENGYPWRSSERITYITGNGTTSPSGVPYLARWFDFIAPGGIVQALLGVNVVLSIAAVVLVGLLARGLGGTAIAQRSMVPFALFPGSVVLSWSYAEAALIVCAAACLLFLQREQWVLAGVAAAIGTATRPNGVAIVAACVVAAAIAIYKRRQWRSLISVASLRSASSLTTPTSASTPVSGVHGIVPSARHGTRAGAGGRRRSASRGASWRIRSAPHTAPRTCTPHRPRAARVRPVLLDPRPLAVADAGLRRGHRRADDRPGHRLGGPASWYTAFPLMLGIAAWWPRRPSGGSGWSRHLVDRQPRRGCDVLRLVRGDPMNSPHPQPVGRRAVLR